MERFLNSLKESGPVGVLQPPMLRTLALLLFAQVAPIPADKPPAPAAPKATPAAEPFYREWKMDDLLADVEDLGTGRDFKQGGRTFQNAGCGLCHAFSTYFQGSGFAPDLTGVGSKFSRDIILQSILEPSASINGQYYATLFTLKSGRTLQGVVVEEGNGVYKVAPALSAVENTIEIKEADVVSKKPSPVSPMPPGLLNPFTREQIIDLFAFLDSKGDPEAKIFQSAK